MIKRTGQKPFTRIRPKGTSVVWCIGLGLSGFLTPASAATSTPPDESWLAPALDAMAGVTGDWSRHEALAGVSWGQLLLSAAVLGLLVIAAEVLRWILRRAVRKQERRNAATPAQAKTIPWLKLNLEALIPPLMLFLWIWGVYAAMELLLVRPDAERRPLLVLRLLSWGKNVGEIAALFWFIFRMIRVVETGMKRWASTTESKWDDVIVALLVRAMRMIVPLVGVMLVVPTLDLPASAHDLFKQATSLLLIGAIGFILYQMICAIEEAVLQQFRIDVKDNLEARKVYTQVKVLKKIAVVIIVIFTAASMLMVFDSVRQLGTSILASAGVLGIIVGFAAQRSIATVLAGFQIALTQPIRLDDVVIVENEWGRIEEITLTYVVVLIWDLRRLVLPINYFIEKPFQNWTRVSADLLGTVFLYMDYTVPLKALRDELDRLLEHNTRWDRKVKGIQVTDCKSDCMEVRVLVSAADASIAWDLRCELREKLIDFLQRDYPKSLPRARAELTVPNASLHPSPA